LTKGLSWGASCDKAGISRSTGYNLRHADKTFDSEVKRLLASPLHQQRIAAKKGDSLAAAQKDWRRQFVVQYRVTGDRNMAANAVGREAVTIERMIDPDSDEFDQELAGLMREEEMRKLWEIEDAAFHAAITGNNQVMQKFLLQNLRKERFGSIKGDSKTLNMFWFSNPGETKALKVLDTLFKNESADEAKRLLETG
jgi:hypothetical protein